MYLGSAIEKALGMVGVTKESVSAWIGDCGCPQRIEALNQWHRRWDAWLRGQGPRPPLPWEGK